MKLITVTVMLIILSWWRLWMLLTEFWCCQHFKMLVPDAVGTDALVSNIRHQHRCYRRSQGRMPNNCFYNWLKIHRFLQMCNIFLSNLCFAPCSLFAKFRTNFNAKMTKMNGNGLKVLKMIKLNSKAVSFTYIKIFYRYSP